MDFRLRDHRRRNVDEPGHAHELTFTCYRRYQFLSAERTCLWLADSIARAREIHAISVLAYVFMPEHAHLLIQPSRPGARIAAILQSIKQPVGQRAIAYIAEHAPA